MTALSLKNIAKSYGAVEVLSEITIDVDDGEFVVFVGPSGCGKSTLLRIVAGLDDATTGEVWIGGENVSSRPPAQRGLALVFQSYALYPHLSVQRNMALALKQAGASRSLIETRVSEASRMLNLDSCLERYPSELSGGQRQRVAIGRALVRQPRLFLFDEPLSNLDAALRMNTRIEIASLHETLGTAIIYVTHDQTEAMTLADTIVVLRDGRVEQIGRPMEIYNNPNNRFVAGFLGSPAMNFFPARLLNPSDTRLAGVRPEDLHPGSGGEIVATVQHVERLGGDTNVIASIGEISLTARMFGQSPIKRGEIVHLTIKPDRVHYFNDDGVRVS